MGEGDDVDGLEEVAVVEVPFPEAVEVVGEAAGAGVAWRFRGCFRAVAALALSRAASELAKAE